MIYWEKGGHIYAPPQNHLWIASHAAVPVADKYNSENIRVYYYSRDKQSNAHITFLDIDAQNPTLVRYIHDKPVLSPGNLGLFDDSGVVCSSIVNSQDKIYLFYVGWNVGVTVPYRNAIGVAVSEDGGLTFERACKGPVVDRTQDEPYFTVTCDVMIDGGIWRMWYTSATGWKTINNKPEPIYTVKYAESSDGIYWKRNNITCIPYKFDGEAIGRPCVIKQNGLYQMWYSYRGSVNFRSDQSQSYRIGYAESTDGISWTRKDEEVGIDVSESGWDSQMIAYPYICTSDTQLLMFYNGNGFGKSGFGYAIGNL